MIKIKHLILGSGIGGLASAAELKAKNETDFIVIDKTSSLPKNFHNGLHYLHSCPETPFEFEYKSIILTEEIWDTRTNTFKKNATIPEMFEYSKKIMENLRHPSSIMDPGKRKEVFIPYSNNMDDLIDAYHNYIGEDKFHWNQEIFRIDYEKKIVSTTYNEYQYEKLISTVPLNKFYGLCKKDCHYQLKNKTIYITNYKTTNIVPNWLIVLYMSDPKFPPYRISVLNNIISMESLFKLSYEDEVIIKYLIKDLFDYDLQTKSEYAWETGRIFGLQKHEREIIIKTFKEIDIYLLGRFATWSGKELIDTIIIAAKKIVDSLCKK